MNTDARTEANRLLEAAEWQMQIDSGDVDRKGFENWLADPLNAGVWQRLNSALEVISDHTNDQRMVGLRRAALEDAQLTSARLTRPRAQWQLKIAAALLISMLGGGAYYWLTAPDYYQTGFNERRILTLADGSRISLDSDSEVTVKYSNTAREISLIRGQARFDVAHDVTRPFFVLAHDQKVVATGTAFNIDITQPKVVVTLIEGRVVVFDGAGTESLMSSVSSLISKPPPKERDPVELRAGQQLIAVPDRTAAVSPADMRATLAWTGGQLVFDDQPLAEVIARVNHYAVQPIVIGDPAVARLRISGSFNIGDVEGFLDIVTHYLPVQRAMGADGDIILSRK